MKVGDLLRHNGTRLGIWLLVEVEPSSLRSILIVNAKTGYRMWAARKAFKVVSKCQENVKSAPNDLQSPSSHVIL